MKNSIIKFILGTFVFSFFMISCLPATEDDHNHDDHAMDDPHAEEEEHHDDEVALTPEQIQKVGLKMGTFENKNLQSTIKVNGQLELPPQNKASVSSIASGKVTYSLEREWV